MTTSVPARLGGHVSDGNGSNPRKPNPAHSARVRDLLKDSLTVELLLQFHDFYRGPK
jgi:hypothetical protein